MIPRATIDEMEEWRPTHHPNYEVSNLGRVRSWAPTGGDLRTTPVRRRTPRVLRPGLTSTGYPSVVLGRRKTHLVHRLVATAFLGACPEGQEVRHKDDDRTNARADNLEYGTRHDNVQDMMKRGRGRYKLSKDLIETIRETLLTHTQQEVAALLGISRMAIYRAVSGRTWA